MAVIWKYTFRCTSNEELLTFPPKSEVLSVDNQNGEICMWVKINDDKAVERELRKFYVVGTGCEIPKVANKFIGTVIISPFVWHVFE